GSGSYLPCSQDDGGATALEGSAGGLGQGSLSSVPLAAIVGDCIRMGHGFARWQGRYGSHRGDLLVVSCQGHVEIHSGGPLRGGPSARFTPTHGTSPLDIARKSFETSDAEAPRGER